jgi:uncharacterized membrane protein YfcA
MMETELASHVEVMLSCAGNRMTIELWQVALLFATGLVAGFVDSIAGGGGLITLPVLLSLGIDPKLALGTNKLQATFGSGSAAFHYARAKAVNVHECRRGFALTFAGALLGSLLLLQFDPNLLKRLIPILLVVVAGYMLFRPAFGVTDRPPRMSGLRFDVLFGLGIGFYDGFLGPGTGTFFAMAFAIWLGFNLTKATAHTKVLNFASNLASLAVFLCTKHVWFAAGLTMGVGQWLGARAGSKMVVKRGTKFIRPIFITVVLAITARLIYTAYWK